MIRGAVVAVGTAGAVGTLYDRVEALGPAAPGPGPRALSIKLLSKIIDLGLSALYFK